MCRANANKTADGNFQNSGRQLVAAILESLTGKTFSKTIRVALACQVVIHFRRAAYEHSEYKLGTTERFNAPKLFE